MTFLMTTVNGTGVPDPFDNGPTSFPGWLGWAVADPWIPIMAQFWGPQWQQKVTWLPVGYPAAVTNMWASVIVGAQNHLATIQNGNWPVGTPLAYFGYSQGAMVVNYIWVNYLLNPDGPLHDRYLNGDVKVIFNVGDPNRSPGIAYGNELAGIPVPPPVDGQVTGGICGAGDAKSGILACLTPDQTPKGLLYSLALPGDLYADAPVGSSPWTTEASAGKVGTSIFLEVQKTNLTNLVKIAEDFLIPIGMVQEIFNGMKFAAAGPNAPHFQYGPYVSVFLNKLQQVVAANT